MNKVVLSPDCTLKLLEEPTVYNIRTDELYTLDGEAFEFLKSSTSPADPGNVDRKFLDYCLEEGILIEGGSRNPWPVSGRIQKGPSLRYIEVLLTDRCNLRCRHCYLGLSGGELRTDSLYRAFTEFEDMGGLKVLLSGGEPMLHSRFREINSRLKTFSFRTVLLTNGFFIDDRTVRELNVHEVQVSMDGLEESHDFLRGRGAFRRAVDAIRTLKRAGMDVTVATMVHRRNRNDFPAMEDLLKELGVRGWSIDVPCVRDDADGVFLPCEEAAALLSYGFGPSGRCSSPGYACGSHLICLTSNGTFARCGFFCNEPVGTVEGGLERAWQNLHHRTLDELECRCPHLMECRGGCRYRASLFYGSLSAPDPVLCRAFGVEPPARYGNKKLQSTAPL